MALKHTKINVRAVTCVAGRHGLKHATANVIRTIQAAGKPTSNTAVYKGCGWPLLGKNHENRVRSEDSDGLGNRSEIDPKRSSQIEVSKRVLTEHASTAISKISKQESNLKNKQAQDRKVGGDYTCKTQDSNVTPDQSSTNQILYSSKLCLVALGPLTNIATAVTLDPDLPSRFSKLVIYGGSLYGLNKNSVPSSNQNSSSESSSNSEFNFNFDPESARIVLEAFTPRIPVIIVPYDACKQNPISFERLPLLQASATSYPEFISLLFPDEIYNQGGEIPGLFPYGYTNCQAYAMAVAMLEGSVVSGNGSEGVDCVILGSEKWPVGIELTGGSNWKGGLVVKRKSCRPEGQITVQLPFQFNLDIIEALMKLALS